MFCRNCGKPMTDNADVCEFCGARVSEEPTSAKNRKSKTTAASSSNRKFIITLISIFAAGAVICTALHFIILGIYKQPVSLIGEWEQANSNSGESYQIATVTDSAIEMYWYSETDNTTTLYWSGTFTAPTTDDEPYTWTSQNNTEKTSTAIMASGDETKDFTYKNGKITYQASMLGVTKTIELKPRK